MKFRRRWVGPVFAFDALMLLRSCKSEFDAAVEAQNEAAGIRRY